ncbi:hypothetical protein GTA08_BOTSDO05512 [Neofusicoccum parvum]|uniref:Uncharacterized protein n=1 Tax=Neofusicoccum parvum TaxID=310453 RepID=A0ACB5RRD9_9PEZI|nr:hypothetical protein GTA08_BOTSDO05512 [Neofusicoccum parvum]GME51077.1 hypothetical protein GTA08_BOTSDO05512 [Neofusicoccum parvum]
MVVLTGLGPTVIAVMWVQTIVALLFVCLRLYTRWRLIRNVGLDDHLSWVSMLLFFLYTVFITIAALNGLGSHSTELTGDQFATAIKWELMGQTCNILAIATSKSSVAVFLIRIVNVAWHKWMLHFCIASTCFVCVSCIILMFTQCTPVQSIWDHRIPTVCHFNFTVNAIFSGSYTAAMDFWLAIFPWFVLWTLNMKRKERLTISFGLSLGVLAGICGIVRAVELNGIAAKADYLYATVPLLLWGSTELLVCLLCATIPVLRPFYKKVTGKGSSTDPYSNNYNTSGNKLPSSTTHSRGAKLDSAAKSKIGIKLSSWRNRGTVSTVVRGGVTSDSASDESALFKDGAATGGIMEITRVTQVDVAYERAGEDHSDMHLKSGSP